MSPSVQPDTLTDQLLDAALVHRAKVEISAAAAELGAHPLDETAAVQMSEVLLDPRSRRARAAYRRLRQSIGGAGDRR